MPVSKLCLFYFLVIFCLGCSDNSSRNEPPVFEYEFKNQSGHKLTIQLIDEYGNFPNPLILKKAFHGEIQNTDPDFSRFRQRNFVY